MVGAREQARRRTGREARARGRARSSLPPGATPRPRRRHRESRRGAPCCARPCSVRRRGTNGGRAARGRARCRGRAGAACRQSARSTRRGRARGGALRRGEALGARIGYENEKRPPCRGWAPMIIARWSGRQQNGLRPPPGGLYVALETNLVLAVLYPADVAVTRSVKLGVLDDIERVCVTPVPRLIQVLEPELI